MESEGTRAPDTAGRGSALLTCAAVLLAAGQATYAAWRQGRTIDEPVHLSWSRRLLETGVGERASQHTFNSKTPALIPHVLLVKAAESVSVPDGRPLRLVGRLATVACLLALLGATFGLARLCFGTRAAQLATIAAALDPSLVAHGSLATVDLPYALATVLALWSALAFAERPSVVRGALMGMAVGLAFAIKFTAVLLLFGLLALPLARGARPWRPPGGALRVAGGLLAAAALACLTICAAYLFLRLGVPLGSVAWESRALAWCARLLPRLSVPLPLDFLTGLDLSMAHERADWPVFILGQRYTNGVWFYFALLWLLKTPILLLLATAAGLIGSARLLLASPAARFVAFNLALSLAYFSFLFRVQVGYRFVLMCVPLAYVLAAAGLARLRETRHTRSAAGLVLAVCLLEGAPYLGNPLAFTNAALWPKRQAFRLISDSNIDWGQNHDKIDGWMAQRGFPRPSLNPPHVVPGINVFGLNVLAQGAGFERHRWLRSNADPAGHLGHTYLWFDVDAGLFDRFLDQERTVAPLGSPLCPVERELSPWPGGPLPVAGDSQRGWVACLETRHRLDVAFETLRGAAAAGECSERAAVGADRAFEGQAVWFRLEPGRHALCVAPLPQHARGFEGRWLVRGPAPSFGLSPDPRE